MTVRSGGLYLAVDGLNFVGKLQNRRMFVMPTLFVETLPYERQLPGSI